MFAPTAGCRSGITLGGGVDFGRQVDDHCFTVDIPNQPAGLTGAQLAGGPFCRVVTSWANLLDFRLRGSAPLPFDMSAGFVYRNTPGAEVNANLTLQRGSPAIRFTNGRPSSDLSAATKTIPLYTPNFKSTEIDSISSTWRSTSGGTWA